jgi:hypothetical protein
VQHAISRLRRAEILRAASTIEQMRLIEVSPAGRAAYAALQVLKDFGDDEELRFGYVVSQLAGSEATGAVSPEVIDVCLNTINSWVTRANEALELRSERLIEETHTELQRQWRWLEKAGEILARLADDPNMSAAVHRKAQQTGKVLATAQKLDSLLKRHGAEIAHQRERMTKSGLTGRMVMDWLRTLSIDALCEFATGNVRRIPHPMFLNPANALDVSHASLDRGRLTDVIAPPLPSPRLGAERAERPADVDSAGFRSFVNELRNHAGEKSLSELIVVPGNFPTTALRLGTLVRAEASSVAQAQGAREPIFDGLSVELLPNQTLVEINDGSTARVTGGTVRIRNTKDRS